MFLQGTIKVSTTRVVFAGKDEQNHELNKNKNTVDLTSVRLETEL